MKLACASCSETGSVRRHNEDAVLACTSDKAGLFLVADGIGGRQSGEVVSGRLREAYRQWWNQSLLHRQNQMSFHDALEEVKGLLLDINREMVQRFGQMTAGSTLALLFLFNGNYALVSAGDSRIYRRRLLSAQQLSMDDVYRSKSAADAAQNGRLTGAVGIRMSLEFNVRTDTLRKQDWFFLCSDGVYRYIRLPVLRRKLVLGGAFSTPEKVVRRIEQEVLKNGAGDNYSMVFVRVYT